MRNAGPARVRWACAALGCLAALGVGRGARADEGDAPASWWQGEDATGTWGGARTRLDDGGLHLDLDYTAESFARLAGDGSGAHAVYRGTVDLVLILDTGKLSLWSGGTLFVYGQNGHGDGISPALGVDMLVSNLEAPKFTQLSELWFEQHLLGDHLRVRLGKQDANRDFAAPRFPGNFIHSSFGAMPTIPMPSFPAPGLGAVLFVEPRPWLSLRSGLYEGAPEIESVGVDTAFDGSAFVVAAAMARHGLGADRPDAVTHTLGGWYHSADIAAGGRTYDGNYGAFAVLDVLVPLAPNDPDDKHSLGGFVRVGWSPPERSQTSFYVGGGITYHPLRANDTAGLGAGHGRFPGDEAAGGRAETFLEAFYKARFAPWFTVEPDLQLVLNPQVGGGAALVGGLRVKLKL